MKDSILKSGVIAITVLCASALFAGAEQDFDAAVKAGKPLSAESAYLKLVKSGEKPDPIRHFQAAMVADQLGKTTMLKDRLMLFVRVAKEGTPEIENALWRLVFMGAGFEYYEMLAAKQKPTETLWKAGYSLLTQLDSANRPGEVLRLADVLMAKFDDSAKRAMVLDVIYQGSQRMEKGYPEAELCNLLMKYPGFGENDTLRYLVFSGKHSKAFEPDFSICYAAKHGAMRDASLSAEISRLDSDGFAKLTDPEKIRARDARLADIRKVRKLCFDGKHSWSALRYFLVSSLRFPKLFYKTVETNGYVAGSCAMYKDLRAQAAFNEDVNFRSSVLSARDAAIRAGRFSAQEIAGLIDANPNDFTLDQLGSMSSLGAVYTAANKAKSPAPFEALAKKFPQRADEIRRWGYNWYVNANEGKGDVPSVKRIFADIARNDRNFRFYTLDTTLTGCKAMSVADKVEMFKSAYVVTGFSAPWKEFKKRAAEAKDPKKSIYADPAVKAFGASIREDAVPGDPMLRVSYWTDRAKTVADMAQATTEFLKAYPSKFGEAKDPRDNAIANWYFEHYRDLVWSKSKNSEDARKFITIMLPKATKDAPSWYWIRLILDRARDSALWSDYYSKLAEVKGTHDVCADISLPKDSEKAPANVDMRKMKPANAWTYVERNWRNLKKPACYDLFYDFLAAHPLESHAPNAIDGLVDIAYNWSLADNKPNTEFLKRFPLEKVEDVIFAKPYPAWRPDTVAKTLEIAYRMGKAPDAVKRFCAWADKKDPSDRLAAYDSIVSKGVWMPRDDKHANPWWAAMIEDEPLKGFIKGPMQAVISAVPSAQAPAMDFANSGIWTRLRNFRADCASEKTKDDACVKAIDDWSAKVVSLILAGARNREGFACEASAWHKMLNDALAAKDPVRAAQVARKAAQSVNMDVLGETGFRTTMKALKDSDYKEAYYLYVDGISPDQPAWLVAEAVKVRASLASSLPGIYPVGEKDPAYPLYVAADELARKNSERAWQILKDPRNQTVFERELLKLPPDFVLWGVEQMRLARGEKDELLEKARNLATAVIAQEGKASPEMVAAMILSRAEGFRDQQNFEAAKLEYQSLRDNPTYHATKYGKKAMFRATDLQIETGNLQGVEATLEYWLSQNDREIQAQAHYFMAKIAFDRKDFDECIKQLRLVFGIDFTHTEARFLQGKWKLATNSEVDETEVLVGRLGDRNMIKPGNQFSITVQDANLSVAGGGAAIPIVVSTQPGGDKELINLYPTSRDPTTFKGLVEVVLAKACPSNRVLDVRGDDTVSYEIEPEFLKERGLPSAAPKKLHVIDDAKMAIGAGAPRTDEKKTEKGVKDLLDEDEEKAQESATVTRRLRPGNPLYIVVKDLDCSVGGEADTVHVSIETSSGDRIESFELKEEKPFTGVFRGKVETSLPPPRAFASDTAAGMNAGDVINSGKQNGWKSLGDGQPGKWFEVDTMDSHLFSEITLETPSVEDVKRIKLIGRMGKKSLSLGTLPAATEESKLGLRCQQKYDSNPSRSFEKLRDYCQTDKAPKSVVVSNLGFRAFKENRRESQCAFFRGPAMIPEGVDTLRLRVVPVSTKRDALRNLWMTLVLDDTEIFSGQGSKLQNVLISEDITPGCHKIELAVVGNSAEDDFDLQWAPADGDPQPVPAEWFDAEKNPDIKDFVKDIAQIVKTPTGFKATFEKPTRLRSFRWEFTDVKSPDVAISRISAKNDAGKDVLPVACDFSQSQFNQTLEVAPGDKITVRYEDERTSSGEKKVHQRDISSSFNDAKISFIFEDVDERGNIGSFEAYRFQPGDSLVLSVTDPDCDTSDAADKVKVTIKNSVGETFERELLEVKSQGSEDTHGDHSGVFKGVIKTCAAGDTNAPPKVLRTRSDDLLTATYDDRENTDPGVPFERTTRIFAVRPSNPVLTLFDVTKIHEIDNSADAKATLERIRRRPGNENVQVVYRDILEATPMSKEVLASTNPIPFNVAAGAIPIRVNDRSRARHSGSRIIVEAVAHSELEKAAAEGRDPDKVRISLGLGAGLSPFRLVRCEESRKEAWVAGTFNGVVRLSLGPVDPNAENSSGPGQRLCVTGSDMVDITVLGVDGQPVIKRTLKLVSDATVGLTDSSFAAERTMAHVGENFYVMVDDADRDVTDEPDKIEVEAVSSLTGMKRKLILSETMPHSGIFTGRLRPMMFAKDETIPVVATGGVASVNETLTDDRFAIGYGDSVLFKYRDELTLPSTPARTLCATGTIFRGSDGNVRLFSKRFTDRDMAVLVQFRLAECLFEQAKEFRKLKQPQKSAAAIDDGKLILEEALKNYPDSAHVVQGEYLLANLYQELATEQRDAGEKAKAIPLYQEALSRFAQILGTWPESEYAARSQYHKALCLEMLEDYGRASEEYVKMTYLYPESELVGEATIRLATYYYTKEKRYDISGHIYRNFQKRFPQHDKAARALFMAGSCYIKQAETVAAEIEQRRVKKMKALPNLVTKVDDCYRDAVETFDILIDVYRDSEPKLRAQTLYWAGDVSVRRKDYAKAYQYLKRTVFEYPETEWARRARGLLLQESQNFKSLE